jgi:hypothetical protein
VLVAPALIFFFAQRQSAAGYWRAMSQENVEIVEAWARAWNRGDRDGWLAPTHPEVEWSSAIQRQVEGTDRTNKGQAEVGRFWDEAHALERRH